MTVNDIDLVFDMGGVSLEDKFTPAYIEINLNTSYSYFGDGDSRITFIFCYDFAGKQCGEAELTVDDYYGKIEYARFLPMDNNTLLPKRKGIGTLAEIQTFRRLLDDFWISEDYILDFATL